MAGLLLRLVIGNVIAALLLGVSIWAVGNLDGTLPLVLGVAGIVISSLMFVYLVTSAATGRIRTPGDLGVGFRVPEAPARQKRAGWRRGRGGRRS